MERIIYRITLDAHRNGIQRTLQGFETSDTLARRICINLVAGGDTFELPMTGVVALMYVTTPSAKVPSIYECVIEGNTIIYDVEPIVEQGITEMQLKLIETSMGGANKVLIAPIFAVEISKSNTDDGGAVQTAKFTALENALAKADAVYNSRVTSIEILDDFTFRVYYADGSYYESTFLKASLNDGNVKMSKSYAVGDAGVRAGENTDNAKYYSQESKSASEQAKKVYEESVELSNDMKMNANYTYFGVNFETGELGYVSTNANFSINKETGKLEQECNEPYTPESAIVENAKQKVDEYLKEIDFDTSADTDYVDDKIRALRGDDSEKTVAGAYENANSKLPMENIAYLEDSLNYLFSVDNPQYTFIVKYPDGFSRDNSCIIGFMFRKGDTFPWEHASGSKDSTCPANVEMRSDKIYIQFEPLIKEEQKIQYRLVLLKMDLG
jgi:hypothetical protein